MRHFAQQELLVGEMICFTLQAWYIFLFGLWFWNIDGAVGRRVYFIFAFVMYIGQAAKDVIRWPRPAMPPCIQLETKWSMEYGMPSTHSMVGLAVPTSILYFTATRYQVKTYFSTQKCPLNVVALSTFRFHLCGGQFWL